MGVGLRFTCSLKTAGHYAATRKSYPLPTLFSFDVRKEPVCTIQGRMDNMLTRFVQTDGRVRQPGTAMKLLLLQMKMADVIY